VANVAASASVAMTFLLAAQPSSAQGFFGGCCIQNPTCIQNVQEAACSQWGGKWDYTDQCFEPCLAASTCGDGSVDAGEQCDDGNTQDVPGNYCRADCVRAACGRPENSKAEAPLTSDALFILRVAVGSSSCDARVCDVDVPAGVAASDALAVLKRAVGIAVALRCPW
jgi:cysteine-rich repeat protein